MLYYANLFFYFLQHFETFDISHVFLTLTTAELSTLKQVRFFGPLCIYTRKISVIFHSFDQKPPMNGSARNFAQGVVSWT